MSEPKHYRVHMSMSIEGCLRNHKRKKITFFTNDDGTQCSDKDARAYLAECLAKGWVKIPTCSDDECPNFDHFGGGCPKHEKRMDFEGTKYDNAWADKMLELDSETLETTFGTMRDGLGKIEFLDKIREKLVQKS